MLVLCTDDTEDADDAEFSTCCQRQDIPNRVGASTLPIRIVRALRIIGAQHLYRAKYVLTGCPVRADSFAANVTSKVRSASA